MDYIYLLYRDDVGDDYVYVGKSFDPVDRLETHLWEAKSYRKKRTKLLQWMRRKNAGPVLQIVLEETDDWLEAEPFWIAYYRSIGMKLLNMTDGGEGAIGAAASDETRSKQSAVRTGVKKTEETKRKISASLKGRRVGGGKKMRLTAAEWADRKRDQRRKRDMERATLHARQTPT